VPEAGLTDPLPFYVEDLKQMLEYKKVAPPYVLIGHSLGGNIIRYFAYLYLEEVAGLIFIDHAHEDWFRYIRETWSNKVQESYFELWDPEVNSHNYKGVGLEELTEYEANYDSIRGKDIPVLMFTGNSKFHYRKDSVGQQKDKIKWAELQKSLISDVYDAKQIIAWNAGYSIHLDQPRMVVNEINKFIRRIKE
jgi:pimeloyl-ACP methyl ester carboxylesterase